MNDNPEGRFPGDTSSAWERGERPVPTIEETAEEMFGENWRERLSPGAIVEIPSPTKVYVVIEDCGYDGRGIEAIFADEDEANAYAVLRNGWNDNDRSYASYDVEPWDLGRPGTLFDGPIFFAEWRYEYHVRADKNNVTLPIQKGWKTLDHKDILGRDNTSKIPVAAAIVSDTDRINKWTGQPNTWFRVEGTDEQAVRDLANREATKRMETIEAIEARRAEHRAKHGPPFGSHPFG